MASYDTQQPDKRVRITDAAIAVFAQKGYHAARVSDVAKEAGVADGTIYLYFRNKEDLLLSIFEEKMEMLNSHMRAALDGVDCPVDQIRVFSKQHLTQLRKYPLIAQVFQVELRQSHKFLREYRPEKLLDYLNIFGDAVTEAQSRGLIRKEVDAYIAKWSFFGALDELSIRWVLSRNRKRFDLVAAADQVAETFLRGVQTAH